MGNYIKLHNVKLPETTGLPRFIERPEDPLASIPGMNSMVVPDYTGSSGEFVRNIEIGENARERTGGVTVWGEFPNGSRSVYASNAPDHPFNVIIPARPVRPDAWSVFFVAMPHDATGSGGSIWQRYLNAFGEEINPGVDDMVICIESSPSLTGVFRVMRSSNTDTGNASARTRVRYVADTAVRLRPKPTSIMWTFSTQDGFHCYDGGVHVLHDDSDKRPLTLPNIHEHLVAWQNYRGHGGVIGLVNNDLSRPEMEGYREMIIQYMLDKYDCFVPGVTEPLPDEDEAAGGNQMLVRQTGEDEGVERPEDVE